MKFISPDFRHRYICKLSNTIDIEFTEDYEEIEQSNRHYIIWNPYGFLAYPQKKYIDKYEYYKKLKSENKPCYVAERGALPDSIFIDKNGFLYDSTSYDKINWNHKLTKNQLNDVKKYIEEFKSSCSTLESQKNTRLSKTDFFNNIFIGNEKYEKIVFVPMQMCNDTVTLMWCDWVKNVRNFQLIIAEMAKKNPDILFLIKNHPNEKTQKMDECYFNIKIADDYHYKDCIEYSDCVLTINSGVGLQAMMWKKPVIIVGKAFYHIDGVNAKANDIDEIEDLIFGPKAVDEQKMLRFIYYLKFVFYSTCIMKKLHGNCSEPATIEKITYETPYGERIDHEKQILEDKQRKCLFELINLLESHCLLKETCLECIQSCELVNIKDCLHIGTKLTKDTIHALEKNNYKFTQENVVEKNGIVIYFHEMPSSTKIMSLYGNPVNVPMPVVNYLRDLYGKEWKKHNIKPKTKTKDKLNIIYTFNNYGWAFEFESRYYKKFSNHNIIPIHQKDLPKYLHADIDLVVVPSAWHWERDLGLNNRTFINQFKEKKVKFVAQYNSELEEKFCTPTADFIMPSSARIYDLLKEKYKYTKMAWFPHFVDTDVFCPKNTWNDFSLGFAGNFKNRFKRPHIVEKLENEFKVEKQCDYHGHLKPNRDHSQMAAFYNSIDIYISPSISEGTPMTMLEAMSCGKIVMMTDTGIARYMIDPFFIIPNTTDDEIYEEFKKRLNILKTYSQNKLLEIGERNRKRVKKLDWASHVHYLDNLYMSLYNNDLSKVKEISSRFITKLDK